METIANKKQLFNPKLIRRGIILFISITVLTFVGLFLYNDGDANLKAWQTIDLKYILLGLVFTFIDLYLGGLRNHIFIREMDSNVTLMTSIKANVANLFMGAVTPSQTGGGPAQWYIWYKNGVSIPTIVGTSFYNLISTVIFFPISGAVAIYVLGKNVPNGLIMNLTKFGFTAFFTVFVLIFVGLYAPKVLKFLVDSMIKFVVKLKPSSKEKLERLATKMIEKLYEYRNMYFNLIKTKPHLMFWSLLITFVMYFSKYLLAYVLALAFGIEANMWSIVSVLAVNYLLLYFAPTPGGSGIAEIGISGMLTPFVTAAVAPSVTLLHRSFLIFIPALLGAYVILEQLKKEGIQSK